MARQVNFGGYLLRQFGAYIRTDLSSLVEVAGVASGIIGITGLAEKGPVNSPVTITSYTQLVNVFSDGPLVRHGLAAFVGGAANLVAIRLNEDSPNSAETATLNVVVDSTDGYTFSAREFGTYGNSISISVQAPVISQTVIATSDTILSDDPIYVSYAVPSDVAAVTTATVGDYAVVENWNYRIGAGIENYDVTRYSIFRWNGTSWSVAQDSDVNYILNVRFGSIEERLEIPYYVYQTDWLRALALTSPAEEGRYYWVLRNIENQQVRPIPENWLAGRIQDGLLEGEDFERVVNSLKSDEEELFNGSTSGESVFYEISLNRPTTFPFELIKHIVNFGGFSTAPSSLITINDEDALTPNPTLVSQNFTSLQGGYNSRDGTGWTSSTEAALGNFTSSPSAPTTAWDTALGLFEDEEVNFIQPAYLFGSNASFSAKYSFFKGIASRFITHCDLASNIRNRKFRTTILGLPSGQDGTSRLSASEFLLRTQDITGTVNSDRAQLWAGGFFSNRFSGPSGATELYGGEWLASFVSGAHASRDVSVSLTFSQISRIISSGTEYSWTSAQKDDLYGRSLAFALKRRTSGGATEYVAAHNYTSFTGAPSKGIQLFVTRRIVDFMNSYIYKNLEENFIGRKSRGASTANEIRLFVDSLLRQLIIQDSLVTFAGLTVTPADGDPTTFYIEYSFQPVTEINFLLTTNKLVYNLA